MTDLTQITTPIGLLDSETLAELVAHGGPYEIFTSARGWQDWQSHNVGGQPISISAWHCRSSAIRVKSSPREWWATMQVLHDTEAKATEFRNRLLQDNPGMTYPPIVHVREVQE